MVLKDIENQDKSKITDHKHVQRRINDIGEELLDAHEKEKKELELLRFDGKTVMVAAPHSKKERRHIVTVVDQESDYVEHFFSGEKGHEIGDGIIATIDKTKSRQSILGIGSGNVFLLKRLVKFIKK